MAIPSRQIGWGTESNLLWQILKQLNKLTSVLFGLKEAATPNYKVYTALLTQTGGDNELFIEDFLTVGTQNIIKGVSYYIDVNTENVDFSSIGAPSNAEGTNFIATADKLNSDFPDVTWSLRYNTGAPVATVLENTLGNILWGYTQAGIYTGTLIEAFIIGKTYLQVQQTLWGSERQQTSIDYNDIDSVIIQTYDNGQNDSTAINNALRNTSIEIRVYN
jgi:hypothetical protein